jgi:glycosyltransferase involved in cell wall biosynthesis
VLGWIGSATTAAYVTRLSSIISRVSRELPERSVTLLLVGASLSARDDYIVESLPWSIDEELGALARIDIGLMPLPDNPWTRGKSAYKALQYMAAGIPVVGDDVGVAAEVIGPEQGGFVVRGEGEWVETLIMLARDSELRGQLGENGRHRVEQSFSVTRWAPVVAEILRREG